MSVSSFFFFFNDTATTEIYTLSLHDALPISVRGAGAGSRRDPDHAGRSGRSADDRAGAESAGAVFHAARARSEEHTSELQSPCNLVCRLLLEKKQKNRMPCTGFAPSGHPLCN